MATTFDTHSLWAYSTIVSVVSQANGTLVFTVQPGDGAKFAKNQQLTFYPANPSVAPYFTFPTINNAMIARVTAISGDQITCDYAVGSREGSSVRNVIAGDQVINAITPKAFLDIENALNAQVTTTPPAPSTTPTTVVPPASSNPGNPPAADPVNFTQGNNVFVSTNSQLTDFNSNSPTNINSETVTSLTPTLTAPAAPTVAAGSSGNPNGAYKCQVTFVTAQGETAGGTEATITVTSQQINWSNIPVGPAGTTARKLYRTAAGGASGTEKLVTTLNDNTATTFTDNVADGSLGTTVPASNTSGTGNPFTSGYAFKFTVDNTHAEQVGLNKDLSLLSTRDFKFSFLVDSGATISGEETIFHAWTDNYKTDLVEIRITNAGSGFNFVLRLPGSDNFASLMRKSNVVFSKNTKYDVELYMMDYGWALLVGPQGGTKNLIIEWYNGFSSTGVYTAVNNVGLFIGGVALGKFYSTQLSGSFYMQNITFYQDYVAPSGPSTAAGQLADVWAGWKKRYLRSDGAIVRPNPEGVNGIYQASSDVVSEGIGYALMFAVQMNDQTTFDLVETWAETNLERTHNSLTAANLMGWHWDDINSAMYDWNFATDADMDRLVALIWAAHRKANGNTGWSASSINYASKATAIANDLKTYAFRTDSGLNYLASDSFQQSADPMEINVSYHSVGAMKVIKNFTNDTFWDNAILGTYDLLTKMANKQMTDNTLSGKLMQGPLPADWVGYSVASHDVSQQPPNNRAIKYSYDAFRTIPRIYWHYLWFNDTNAKNYLTGALRTFFNQQWATLGLIYAEYFHDGTVLGAYEKSMMTFNAYLCGLASSAQDATAAAIWTNKLANLYTKSYPGGFYKDNSSSQGAPSYFNNSWMLFAMMVQTGQFTNF